VGQCGRYLVDQVLAQEGADYRFVAEGPLWVDCVEKG
jgi:hypothetical protein